MTSSTSLTLTLTAAPRLCRPCLKPALRSILEMSGLFDTGVTGDDLFSVAPADEKQLLHQKMAPPLSPMLSEDSQTLEEMLKILETDSPLPVDGHAVLRSPDPSDATLSPPPTSADGLLGGEGGMHFFEGFTNLTDYLFTTTSAEPMDTTVDAKSFTIESISENVETNVTVVSSTEGMSRKRTAVEAFADCFSAAPVNPDHCDYACKKLRKSTPTATTTADSAVPTFVVKDPKYRERRTKNNIASKRSRETRKQKYCAMEIQAIELEASNAELEKQIEELEKLTKTMKDVLVQRLSHAPCLPIQ